MQVVHERCAGLDVHKKSIFGCVLWFDEKGNKQQEIRSFGATTVQLLQLADWLKQCGITRPWRIPNDVEIQGF